MSEETGVVLSVDSSGVVCALHGFSRFVDSGMRRRRSTQFVGDGGPPIIANEVQFDNLLMFQLLK